MEAIIIINERSFIYYERRKSCLKNQSQPKAKPSRQAIEDAAVELFMEQGYHATSMRQIAERAGLALGGIYNHFASKEEIFEAIIVDKHPYKKILPSILEAEGETAEEFFRNAAQLSSAELGKGPDFMKLMFIELVEFNGKHMPAIVGRNCPENFACVRAYGKASQEPAFDQSSHSDAFVSGNGIFILYYGITYWRLPEETYAKKQLRAIC